MAWNPLDQPVDFIKLAGDRSPGIADVAGAGSPRKWDEAQGYGLSGSTLRFTGLGLAKFDVKLRLYTRAHWAAWHAWKRHVQKPPLGKRPRALDIWHPCLEDLEIKSVVVEDVLQPELTDDRGEWTIAIKFIQFRLPKLTLAKPEASKAQPLDAADQTIGNLIGIVDAGGRGSIREAVAPLFSPNQLSELAQ
jgi:hypothetical protein